MNSNLKGFCKDEKESCCKRPKETEVLLRCKVGSLVTVPITMAAAEVTTPLVKVNLNTGRFHNHCIEFEYSTNLVATVTNAIASLRFQLFKICKGEMLPEIVGNPWVYPNILAPGLTDIITFKVCNCDCDCDKDDCCSYYVAAITSAVADGEGPNTASLIFNNSTLAALVVGR